ncbi:extracellular solute-binding protein [Micromonospora chokoriensis]|uniref:extracellular solute-binding protein n=1 Tax=Micromonospora chokoriensis TaxID=356851 RepID=UPI0004C3399F|nr:extracellular solute-binding protein [Micromonospora chokoriensis]
MNPRSVGKIVIAFTAAAALTVAGCSSSNGSKGEAPKAEFGPDGKVILDVFAQQDQDTDLNTNLATKAMSDKFKIQFKFQTSSMDAAASKEKRQISLASGDYPDLFMLIPYVDAFSKVEVQKLGKQGVAVPLEDLIKEHAPNVQKLLDSNKIFREMSVAPDGHIYALPQAADCYHCSYPDKLWINSTWLKNLGLQQPKTTEDLRTVLRAFKTQDPNRNGKADEIPMTTDLRNSNLIGYLMGGFAYAPVGATPAVRGLLTLDGDKVTTPVDKPEWRDGLRYINSLYKEGLIDPGSFTQPGDALQAIGNNPKGVQIGSSPVLHPGIFVTLGSKDGRDKQYDAVPPLTGPTGKSYTALSEPTSTGYSFLLTNKASKEGRIAAIKLLDHMFTDAGKLETWSGPENVWWVKPAPGDVALDANTTPMYKSKPEAEVPKNVRWAAMATYNFNTAFRNAQVVPKDIYSEEGYERRLFEATKLYEGREDKAKIYPEESVWVDSSVVNELATMKTNLDSYVTQGQLAFITGSKNIDTEWDAWVKGLDGVGLKRYLELNQQAYDKHKSGK